MKSLLKGFLTLAICLGLFSSTPASANSLLLKSEVEKQQAAESKSAKSSSQEAAKDNAQEAAKDKGQEDAKEMALSLPEDDGSFSPTNGTMLALPKEEGSLDFLAGGWRFERDFVQPDGKKAHVEFVFDKDGKGKSYVVTEDGVRYESNAQATYKDGKLKIQTERYTNPDREESYSAEFIECWDKDGKTYCKGSNGWSNWANAKIVKDDEAKARTEESSSKSESSYSSSNSSKSSSKYSSSESADYSSSQKSSSNNGGSTGDSSSESSYSSSKSSSSKSQKSFNRGSYQGDPAEVAAHHFAELFAGGAELPPSVMENAEKAKADKKASVASLEGDWRYSKDLARKKDGQSVSLEFHFGKNGNGTSVIKDSSGKDFQAEAEAMTLPDSTIRVKTSSYRSSKGEESYYPTFMECRPSKGKGSVSDLSCDVSNGWTRLEDGSLVSIESLGGMEAASSMMLLVPGQDISAFESSKASKESKLSLPKAGSSMSFLKGTWRCNTGLVRTSDQQPVVMDFSFDDEGDGNSVIREQEGTAFQASAKASFEKGILRINTSEFRNKKVKGGYPRHFIECTQKDGIAICSGKNGNIEWQQATFTRLK